jgi:serine/threonine protein kinase
MSTTELAGRQLGSHVVEERLGGGTFADVYAARHVPTGDPRAVKVIKPVLAEQPDFRARFAREAVLAARLVHPHVITVYEHDAEGPTPYIAMELARAGSLADRMVLGGQHLEPVLDWVLQVASALDHAHDQGVLHRDVKPANVLIDAPPGEEAATTALLADFGFGRLIHDDGLTLTGLAIGSFPYMSPEQCRGEVRGLDRRADVYSLAATLFELVTGRPPFGVGPQAIEGHLTHPVPSAISRNPALSGDLDVVLARGLARAPEQRYERASELARDFVDSLGGRGTVLVPALRLADRWLHLGHAVTMVGRAAGDTAPDVDLTPLDPQRTVSRRHAMITWLDARPYLRDLGSLNGTWLNGTRLQPESATPLTTGDQVRFGRVRAVWSDRAPVSELSPA